MNGKEKLEFEKALELRNFETENFWKRAWFFGALVLAMLSGYFTNLSIKMPFVPPICISFLVFIFSLAQSLMNRGSKYWQDRWAYITIEQEKKLGIDLINTETYEENSDEIFAIHEYIQNKGGNFFTKARRISVSKLTFWVWDIISISCFMLWINDISNLCAFQLKILIFHMVIAIYAVPFVCKKGKVFKNTKIKNDSVYE